MNYNYTRQRQGRDFPLSGDANHLKNAQMSVEGRSGPPRNGVSWGDSYNNIDGILGNNDPKPGFLSSEAAWGGKDGRDKKKSLNERLEQYKEEAARNAAPVDGRDPPPERGI